MSRWERSQSLLVLLAAAMGVGAGLVWPIGPVAGAIVLPALLLMLTAVFVQLEPAQVRAVGSAPSVVVASLVLNFVLTPLLAWALGAGLLGGAPDLRIGLLLLLVTPCTDWYLVFTALARGHTGIAAALLPVNLLLQLALLPVYVPLLGGEAALIGAGALARSVLLVLGVPLVVAALIRWLAARRLGPDVRERLMMRPAARSILPLLLVAVAAMFAWQARTVLDHAAEFLSLALPLAIFYVVAPIAAVAAARMLRLPADQRVTLTMVTTARNSPIALALAVAAFPDRPLIAVALVIGPLVELPILAVLSQVLRAR